MAVRAVTHRGALTVASLPVEPPHHSTFRIGLVSGRMRKRHKVVSIGTWVILGSHLKRWQCELPKQVMMGWCSCPSKSTRKGQIMRRHTQRKPARSRIGLRKQQVLIRVDPDSAMRATIVFQSDDKGSVSFGIDISVGHVRPGVVGRGDDE